MQRALLSVSMLFCLSAEPLSATEYRFTKISVPGSIHTEAYGINAQGDIVGAYVTPDEVRHAFLLRGHCGNTQIDAVVAVICHRAAAVVFHPCRRIMIDILLDETGLAEFAIERQRKAEGRLLLLSGGARRACGRDKQRQCDTDNDTKRQGALLDCAGCSASGAERRWN